MNVYFFHRVRIRKFPFFHFASLRSKMKISGRMRGFIHFRILLKHRPSPHFLKKPNAVFSSKPPLISGFYRAFGLN